MKAENHITNGEWCENFGYALNPPVATRTLLWAIDILQEKYKGKQVTAIQFEDGSGHRFNYQIDNGKWQYIDIKNKMQAFIKPVEIG